MNEAFQTTTTVMTAPWAGNEVYIPRPVYYRLGEPKQLRWIEHPAGLRVTVVPADENTDR